MVSLAELRARNVTPSWQEAVAVLQELIQTVKATSGSAELLPDLEHIALIPNGDVVALPGSPESPMPVRHAAVMLKLLVDNAPVPPELDQFITRNVSDSPQYDSVAEFTRNLAFFERPGRRSDVERLVGRAIAAEQTTRAEEELKRLKERASEVTQPMTSPDFLQQPQGKKPQTVPIAAVAALGVVVIGAGLWVLTRMRAPSSAVAVTQEAPASADAVAQDASASARAATGSTAPADPAAASAAPGAAGSTAPAPAGASAGGSVAPADPAAAPTTPAPAGAPTRRSFLERAGDAIKSAVNSLIGSETKPVPAAPEPAATAAAPPATADMKTGDSARSRPRRAATASPAPAAAAPAPASEAAPAATSAVIVSEPAKVEPEEGLPVIFTAADPTVTPAVIVRPALPKDPPPGVPPEQIGTIDVIIDEQGDVVSVKLISPANRYHERMLVSAAKMWKFRPAYKDGHPVRYKARVRLTI